MDFQNGAYRVLSFLIEGSYRPVGCLTSNGFTESAGTIPTTTREVKDGWQTQRVVNQQYNIDFEGLLGKENDSLVVSFDKLTSLKRTRSLISWKIESFNTPNTYLKYGQGQLLSLSETATVDEFVSFSASMIGFGMPNDSFSSIYYPYLERAEALGLTFASDNCTRNYINKLLGI